jgi:chromosome segregation ATPase
MATRANITSVEAIESFRANLIVYLSKAKPALEEVSAEIVRTRIWLQGPQRTHWEGVVKKLARELEEAKAALFSSKISNLREVSSAEQLAVTKAKRKMDEADSKLRILRRWDRDFDNQVEPMTRKLEKMQVVLTDDLEKAVTHLAQTINTLDAYARIIAPSLEGGPGASGEVKPAATSDPDATAISLDAAVEKGDEP